ncbi:MAG: hypothetical protein KKD77_20845 [Gammaproteobacteria bacterium]|nr:hypothetical protein [Gammaproteobacteria bacterium]
MDFIDAESLIKKHEGYRDVIYPDSLGIPTLGWGHALHVGSKVPIEVSEKFFERDFKEALMNYDSLEFPRDITDEIKAVILDMLFNLGLTGFKGFKNFIAAVRRLDREGMAYHMMQSKWAEQTGNRAIEDRDIILKGG